VLLALFFERLTRPKGPSVAGDPEAVSASAPLVSEEAAEDEPVVAVSPETTLSTEPSPEPEPEPESEPEPEPEPEPVPLRDRLARTQETLVGRLTNLLGTRKVDEALLEELEMMLFTADLGVATAESLLGRVREKAAGAEASVVRQILREAIYEKLERAQAGAPRGLAQSDGLHVILVLGVNGSGKTTTIGKLASRYAAQGRRVVLGAGDTFRAAAVDQLQVWGERAAVAFDTVKAALARKADVAIIDTAGRLQTKKPLMEELGKIARVLGRDLPEAPHETLLVLDSNTGQNALSQARLFAEVTQVSGLVLTKLDGSAKGGVIVGLADELGLPVRFVGVGEGIQDLRDFDAQEFVDALFGAE
jgi:fused signal recognition particle receptor